MQGMAWQGRTVSAGAGQVPRPKNLIIGTGPPSTRFTLHYQQELGFFKPLVETSRADSSVSKSCVCRSSVGSRGCPESEIGGLTSSARQVRHLNLLV